ncbi:MAG: SRPBCC family protein [Ketobacteraceae bacterium]|nr:SRPBCC family protein [Ketobacteraceae bacterium]
MSEASYQVVMDIGKPEAWQRLRDLSLAHYYVPGLVKTEITTERREGPGVSRRVYQSATRYLEETVTQWDEGNGFTIRLHKGEKDAPFRDAFFRYELKDAGNGKTRLITTMGYTPPLGGVGRVLDKWILNRVISKVIRDVALSMKLFYETGEPTDKTALKSLKQSLA